MVKRHLLGCQVGMGAEGGLAELAGAIGDILAPWSSPVASWAGGHKRHHPTSHLGF